MSSTPKAEGSEPSQSPQRKKSRFDPPPTPVLTCRYCGGQFLPEGLGQRAFQLCALCIKTDPLRKKP